MAAAVFRRGDAVWVVFDAAARFDLAAALHGPPPARRVEAVSGPGWSGVRIASPASVPVSAQADGAAWTVTLGPPAVGAAVAEQVVLAQEDEGVPALSARLAGARGVRWITDPAVGDRIAVAPALPPAKGLVDAHAVVGAELLPSAQGLAVLALADDLQVTADGDLVRIGRPRGLALSPPGAPAAAAPTLAAAMDLPAASAAPGFVDFAAWSRTGGARWTARYDDLLSRAAVEQGQGRGAPTAARMGLARFLVGSELSFEAIGVLKRPDARGRPHGRRPRVPRPARGGARHGGPLGRRPGRLLRPRHRGRSRVVPVARLCGVAHGGCGRRARAVRRRPAGAGRLRARSGARGSRPPGPSPLWPGATSSSPARRSPPPPPQGWSRTRPTACA